MLEQGNSVLFNTVYKMTSNAATIHMTDSANFVLSTNGQITYYPLPITYSILVLNVACEHECN